MILRLIAMCLMCFFTALPLHAGQGAIEQHINKLEEAYRSLQDLQASFQQETSSGSVDIVQRASGKVFFKKAGKMLWEYRTPEAQQIILDGKTLWFYLPAEKQVMKNNFSTIPQHIVVDLFRGQINILEKFKVNYVQRVTGGGSDQLMLELVPLVYNPTISKLTLWLDPERYLVCKSSLLDEFGNRTDLEFSEIKLNQSLSDTLFTFTPPPGVDVFEPPQL